MSVSKKQYYHLIFLVENRGECLTVQNCNECPLPKKMWDYCTMPAAYNYAVDLLSILTEEEVFELIL